MAVLFSPLSLIIYWVRISWMSVKFLCVMWKVVVGYTTKLIFHARWFLPSKILLCCFRERLCPAHMTDMGDSFSWPASSTFLNQIRLRTTSIMCPDQQLLQLLLSPRDKILPFRTRSFPSRSMFCWCFLTSATMGPSYDWWYKYYSLSSVWHLPDLFAFTHILEIEDYVPSEIHFGDFSYVLCFYLTSKKWMEFFFEMPPFFFLVRNIVPEHLWQSSSILYVVCCHSVAWQEVCRSEPWIWTCNPEPPKRSMQT